MALALCACVGCGILQNCNFSFLLVPFYHRQESCAFNEQSDRIVMIIHVRPLAKYGKKRIYNCSPSVPKSLKYTFLCMDCDI